MEFPSFSRWSQLGLFLSSLSEVLSSSAGWLRLRFVMWVGPLEQPSLREERNRPSWLHLEKEGNSIMHVQWALDHVPGSHGDNTATAKLASRTDKHDSILRIPVTKKNVIILYVVNDLCNLCGTHWCRLQCITSWPFWLWIMAVTWLYLPLTFSRLGLRNLGVWAWACTLKVYKAFIKVSWGPWGPWSGVPDLLG